MPHKRRVQTKVTPKEMIKIGKHVPNISFHSCQPKDKGELEEIIYDRISKEGPNCDLNDVDTSLIVDMSYLFEKSSFNGDISNWNVSNVKDMSCMFSFSEFNGDISRWDMSNSKSMDWMFAWSNFNQDISNWKINKDCSVWNVFKNCSIKEEFKPKLPIYDQDR